ncbi:M18 family aminopeptidase [Ferribacterium limneticum]|uniref:M18 family aminopeptidase n=1 Tax=Ferribacterium limneticum TaxID=76259 RepID=UPI001CF9B9B7|nr:M18 family aminopeptidase [Ferribacterium limneticum]UCV27119.1 M18 family aminopeptidase [Ferribacterium limneticum]UCV31036.1 M18 family aminopeptidase [Ferribacterium limneticum]
MNIPDTARAQAQDLLDFIDASPSPWHAVQTCETRLQAAGFSRLEEVDRWTLSAGSRHYVVRGGSSIIAFIVGQQSAAETGLRMIGAHTDSPGLRLKPKPAEDAAGMVRLGVEVYGGPILATFADRDLSLAGRVNVRTPGGFATRLVHFAEPLLRLPNLAIHMNREVNESGLKFNKQTELPLLLGVSEDGTKAEARFRQPIAGALGVEPGDLLTWELNAYDTQKGSFWGVDREFIANSQLDNLASCHAALSALLATKEPQATCLCAFFDHEEVGSESAAGAGGSFVSDVISRLATSAGLDGEDQRRMLARSFFISADMAHGWHPNFPAAYEPCHHATVNAGPVIKSNANQRYSTNADTAARFMAICAKAGVPCQQYAHRTDLGCGSTIGPIVASRLGIPSVDVGSPMWAMHSIRESAGVLDHTYMISALTTSFTD